MSTHPSATSAPLTAAIGGLVAVLGAIVAVVATGSASPLLLGLLSCLGIVLLVVMGIVIGNDRKKRTK